MKVLKKFIIIAVVFTFSLGLAACDGENTTDANELMSEDIQDDVADADEHTNEDVQDAAPDADGLTIADIQDDPASFLGEITLIGIVGTSETRDFSLQNELGTFEVFVDYNGNQTLPELGSVVMVEGTLTENRPCCGPGFTISTIRFDPVEE